MEIDSTWLRNIADWGWGLLIVFAAYVHRLGTRVTMNDGRIKALEDHHEQRTQQLDKIDGKIDDLRKEVREDIRMVIGQLLDKVPPARRQNDA